MRSRWGSRDFQQAHTKMLVTIVKLTTPFQLIRERAEPLGWSNPYDLRRKDNAGIFLGQGRLQIFW
jgi:hypothetical protein